MNISLIEREILDVASHIGAVADSNAQFTYRLAARLDLAGKPLADFTIAEFLYAVDRCTADFNRSVGAPDPDKGGQPS